MKRELSRRERLVLTIGGAAATLLLVVFAVILPYRESIADLERKSRHRQEQIGEAQQLVKAIRAMQNEANLTARRLKSDKTAPLVPTLEELVGRFASRSNLIAIRPQSGQAPAGLRRETVELQLEKLRLEQLVRLLYAIDTAPVLLQSDSVKIRSRFEDPALLDVTLIVSAFSGGGQ